MEMTQEQVDALPWKDEFDSSKVARVAFGAWRESEFIAEADVGILYVEFHGGGRIYSYDNVRSEQVQEMLDAESVGGYFNAEVKGKYHATRIEVVD